MYSSANCTSIDIVIDTDICNKKTEKKLYVDMIFTICCSFFFFKCPQLSNIYFISFTFRSACLAIVDSGTSGLGIPVEYYKSILKVVTAGMDCIDTSCVNVRISDFPVLLISLDPDSTFPLLPSDYVECSCKYCNFYDMKCTQTNF